MLRKTALALLGLLACGTLPACTSDQPQSPTAAISDTSSYGLFYLDEGASAKLAYGQANSDNVGLMLECAKGSRLVELTDVVRSSPAPVITLISAGARSDLRTDPPSADNSGVLIAHAKTDAPALEGFRRTGSLEVAYAGLHYRIAATPQARRGVERFFSACETRS
jgi:hypothetical protein